MISEEDLESTGKIPDRLSLRGTPSQGCPAGEAACLAHSSAKHQGRLAHVTRVSGPVGAAGELRLWYALTQSQVGRDGVREVSSQQKGRSEKPRPHLRDKASGSDEFITAN